MAGGAQLGPLRVPLVWNAKDGQITFVFLFGSAFGPFTRKFVDYLYEQGACDQAMRDTDWIGYGAELISGRVPMRYTQPAKNSHRGILPPENQGTAI